MFPVAIGALFLLDHILEQSEIFFCSSSTVQSCDVLILLNSSTDKLVNTKNTVFDPI